LDGDEALNEAKGIQEILDGKDEGEWEGKLISDLATVTLKLADLQARYDKMCAEAKEWRDRSMDQIKALGPILAEYSVGAHGAANDILAAGAGGNYD
jgi:hypothetical protein